MRRSRDRGAALLFFALRKRPAAKAHIFDTHQSGARDFA